MLTKRKIRPNRKKRKLNNQKLKMPRNSLTMRPSNRMTLKSLNFNKSKQPLKKPKISKPNELK